MNHLVDIDDPIQLAAVSAGSGPEPSPESISMMQDMGFTAAQARKALRETVRFLAQFHLPSSYFDCVFVGR